VEQETEAVTEAVVEVAETVILSTYDKIGAVAGTVFAAMFISLLVYRFARAFHSYIYTGEFMKFIKSSVFGTLIDECPEDSMKALFTGSQPFGIMLDALFMVLIVLIMPFAWGVIVPIILIVLLAYVMRLRIAKKQDFVSKLDGSHPDLDDRGSGDMVQSATTSMRGH